MKEKNKNWKTVILQEGEGEKILFRIGLMTFKVASSQSGDNFMMCETALPPGTNVEPHSHEEAETFYILEGEFTFYVEDMNKPIRCTKGAFVSVPPHVKHSFKNTGGSKGKVLGTIVPGGAEGLESLFRTFGVTLTDKDVIPDLNQPVEHFTETINKLREYR
ncbi:quercetin dioxygenase-like cupin family protein [Catalinimonas alkaloidigena]|uniref:cupin domain-containing protein n=1 Tax=Catalinimonas alkaloidigena TaxID=1075417 RepID=UPI0024063A15|nr:cupin domain-containing protein [Catalinimonas alkaloidigena]MDF9796416.1 quercetin dioxygenase-like cupin family protein [Catalinimonas alkaloidigena]